MATYFEALEAILAADTLTDATKRTAVNELIRTMDATEEVKKVLRFVVAERLPRASCDALGLDMPEKYCRMGRCEYEEKGLPRCAVHHKEHSQP